MCIRDSVYNGNEFKDTVIANLPGFQHLEIDTLGGDDIIRGGCGADPTIGGPMAQDRSIMIVNAGEGDDYVRPFINHDPTTRFMAKQEPTSSVRERATTLLMAVLVPTRFLDWLVTIEFGAETRLTLFMVEPATTGCLASQEPTGCLVAMEKIFSSVGQAMIGSMVVATLIRFRAIQEQTSLRT